MSARLGAAGFHLRVGAAGSGGGRRSHKNNQQDQQVAVSIALFGASGTPGGIMAESPKVITEVDGHLFTIRINRPAVRNCVDGEAAELLGRAWVRFRDDPELWVAILTGTGEEAFCAGADLGAIETLDPTRGARPSQIRRFVHSGEGFMGQTRMVDAFKPIVAAINGDALAGGLELACMADLRIVEEHARLGVACRRFGVPLCDGGTQRLPRIVGMGRAMDLILTGRFIDAREAHFMGLANDVVPKGGALEVARELAARLCEVPQTAMRTDKQAAVTGFGRPLEEGLRLEAGLALWALNDPVLIAGARAFKARRAPRYQQGD